MSMTTAEPKAQERSESDEVPQAEWTFMSSGKDESF